VAYSSSVHTCGLALFLIVTVGTATAQVTEVVVGITPTCPYGCWAGASAALRGLAGVKDVDRNPDGYNCTMRVDVDDGKLPDLALWKEQFEQAVHEAFELGGVEVTIEAAVVKQGDSLVLQSPGLDRSVTLAPLKNKLQWNWKKHRARQPEADEQQAYQQLLADVAGGAGELGEPLRIAVTGPLKAGDNNGYTLQVREYFVRRDVSKDERK